MTLTREERVEAAARAIDPWAFDPWVIEDPDFERLRGIARTQAVAALDAAYPELSSDPPTAWVAPMTLGKVGFAYFDGEPWSEVWVIMRDQIKAGWM